MVESLLAQRWAEAQRALGLRPGAVRLTWAEGDYPHFQRPRGYAVTFSCALDHCHIRFAKKMRRAPISRIDGVMRHEIGHVVDLTLNPDWLDTWALTCGVVLPSTPERRADAIAVAIWGTAITYDHELVQTTDPMGLSPRPVHLGL